MAPKAQCRHPPSARQSDNLLPVRRSRPSYSQHQGVGDGEREMTVRSLDGAVLAGDASVVAGGDHAVMTAEVFSISARTGSRCDAPVERRSMTIGLFAGLRPGPKIGAQHHMGGLEAAVREPEVTQSVMDRRTRELTPSCPVSVKSHEPSRPDICTGRNITSCSSPWMARQERMRRLRGRLI